VSNVVFHPLAERELIEAAKFYETRAAGLGEDFIRRVQHALVQIVVNPHAGNRLAEGLRRRLLQRFPFCIIYLVGPGDDISVIAVMHLKRRPGYWRRRLTTKS